MEKMGRVAGYSLSFGSGSNATDYFTKFVNDVQLIGVELLVRGVNTQKTHGDLDKRRVGVTARRDGRACCRMRMVRLWRRIRLALAKDILVLGRA